MNFALKAQFKASIRQIRVILYFAINRENSSLNPTNDISKQVNSSQLPDDVHNVL